LTSEPECASTADRDRGCQNLYAKLKEKRSNDVPSAHFTKHNKDIVHGIVDTRFEVDGDLQEEGIGAEERIYIAEKLPWERALALARPSLSARCKW